MEFTVEDDNDLPDGLMAETAVEKLRAFKEADQPFFLGLGFFKPHLPFVAPKQDWEFFQNRHVPPPPHPEVVASPHWHKSGEFYKYDTDFEKTWPLNKSDAVSARKAYLACVRYTDRQVGKLLAALEETGQADNTIVVVWGDHGWHLGDSAIWGKHTPFERANHSTLIIRAPGVSRPGVACSSLVETVDLFPTLVDLCQPSFQQTQHPLDGVSLTPLLTGSEKSVRQAAVSYWRNSVTVRSDTHRLIVEHDKKDGWTGAELYDIGQTPDPVRNIAADNPQLVQQLSTFLPSR
jgi:arylsulfatase A-like enzyme